MSNDILPKKNSHLAVKDPTSTQDKLLATDLTADDRRLEVIVADTVAAISDKITIKTSAKSSTETTDKTSATTSVKTHAPTAVKITINISAMTMGVLKIHRGPPTPIADISVETVHPLDTKSAT